MDNSGTTRPDNAYTLRVLKVFLFDGFAEANRKIPNVPGKKVSKDVSTEAGTMQPTIGTQSTMNKTHTHATHPKSYYTYSVMPNSCREHIWKSISYKKIRHLHHFNTPHTSWLSSRILEAEEGRPSGGNVCALHASLFCMSVYAYANSFVIRSLSCKSDECTRTHHSSSFLPSCSSPVILFPEPLAGQLEDIKPVSCELLIGVSRVGLPSVPILSCPLLSYLVLSYPTFLSILLYIFPNISSCANVSGEQT